MTIGLTLTSFGRFAEVNPTPNWAMVHYMHDMSGKSTRIDLCTLINHGDLDSLVKRDTTSQSISKINSTSAVYKWHAWTINTPN